MRIWPVFLFFPLLAGAGEVFTRDGVTDGDTFYLAPAAHINNDPVYQSWVAYSLMKSACQLELGGPNPARANSFECEFRSRQRLLEAWRDHKTKNMDLADEYLDTLAEVQHDGFLAEYVVHFFAKNRWSAPEGLRAEAFDDYRQKRLSRHTPQTRVIGSWNYKEIVDEAMRNATAD